MLTHTADFQRSEPDEPETTDKSAGDSPPAPTAAPADPGPSGSDDADPSAPATGTKTALVVDMLRQDSSATLDELTGTTSWLPHTARAALTALRKRGYIQSQKSEGWSLVQGHYDDGGFSGGSMERPTLARLLRDVQEGKVDVVVVYKVDRLTRSLNDFARIVDVSDATGASFVSVTQQFNTTISMGRLTLNVLLSFAQFEREVIAERVRDKIAQSKAKGIWMGGAVPIGYDVINKNLIPNADEAKTVEHIYRRYLELPSVMKLMQELKAQGIVTKRELGNSRHGSLLIGMIRDHADRPMSPSHAVKKQRRYRYYVSSMAAAVDDEAARVLPCGCRRPSWNRRWSMKRSSCFRTSGLSWCCHRWGQLWRRICGRPAKQRYEICFRPWASPYWSSPINRGIDQPTATYWGAG